MGYSAAAFCQAAEGVAGEGAFALVFGEAHGDDGGFWKQGVGLVIVGVACGTCQAAEAVAGVGDVGSVVWFGKTDRPPIAVGTISGFALFLNMLSRFQIVLA
jgi:hypothetical protein